MLYDVLPMAITADSLLAVSYSKADPSATSTIKMHNVSEIFPSRSFEVYGNKAIEIDTSAHEWTNYFKTGYNGALNILRQRSKLDARTPLNMNILVDGNVPSGSGLSSSAAFVCASVLATLVANGESSISKSELVEAAIVSERAVGVNSGG
jgi:galactokinase